MDTLINIILFVVIAYFVLVGMVATYLITFAKDEERKRHKP
jgi:flagellar basal body-associated protein FliL